ASLL
ncbi:flhB HrpN YscU SpaS family protein, partial [Vibrio parahaemolyticus AQ3810]